MPSPQSHDMTARPLARPGLRVEYRLLAVLAAATLAVWAGASPASAHNTLTSTNPAGVAAYTVAGRVSSIHGHAVSGTFSFPAETAAGTQPPSPPQTSPPATPTPTQPGRMPAWLKLLIGAVAIIFGVSVARRASRRGNASRPD
jgi:hypothetical protein